MMPPINNSPNRIEESVVTSESDGRRLDEFAAVSGDITRSVAQKLISDGNVTVLRASRPAAGALPESKNFRVHTGDTVYISYPPPVPCEARAEDISVDIVYEDDDIAVINKAKGMVVHPAAGNPSGTLVNALLAHCSLSGIGGVIRPGIVHRIDKETSGLLVVAKNDAAHLSLSSQLKTHSVRRVYHAVAAGAIKEPLTLDFPIGRSQADRKKMAVTDKNSKNAITRVYPIAELTGATYIRCELETGRTHQIRVHLSHIGHPLIGDALYGGLASRAAKACSGILSGQCLHAKELFFTHPRTGEEMRFETELPEYFTSVLSRLGYKDGAEPERTLI